MTRLTFLLNSVAAAAVLLGGCSSTGAPSAAPDSPLPSSGTSSEPGGLLPVGPGISVEEALASDLDAPLLVNGALFIVDGVARLCSAILESYPPQCGGNSIVVAGLDPDAIGVETVGNVSWVEGIQILGTIKDGVLTTSDLAS